LVTGVMGITAFPAGVGQNWDSIGIAEAVEKPVESLESGRPEKVNHLNPGPSRLIHRIQPFRTRG